MSEPPLEPFEPAMDRRRARNDVPERDISHTLEECSHVDVLR
jgi:hypothetical protein